MTKKEERTAEIMTEEGCSYDVAELLFQDELEERYPNLTGDVDTMEMLFETEND